MMLLCIFFCFIIARDLTDNRCTVSALLGGVLSTCIAIIVATVVAADGYHAVIAPLVIAIICSVLFFVGWSISNILLMIPMLVYNIALEICFVAGAVWSIYCVVDPPVTALFCDGDDDCDTRWICIIIAVLLCVFSGIILFSIQSIARYIAVTKENVRRSTLRTVTYSTTMCDAIPAVPPSYATSTGVTRPHFFVYPLANSSISTNSPMYMNAPITLNDSSSSTHQRSHSEQNNAIAPPSNENEKFREDIAPPPYQP
uniref:MARVEL domain-containing protein n=1 Tax=Parascaris univalens TaxID=6257 RepID=A0A915AAU8_PARUN